MARRRRPADSRSPSPTTLVWLGVAVGFVILSLVALLPKPTPDAASTTASPSTVGPLVGDHWHAILTISICGEVQPPLAATPGDVHTHGDGLIHIHPNSPQTAGANANLARFFSTTGIVLTSDTLQLPGGRLYRNGDPCPDGTAGRVLVTLNDVEVTDLQATIPRDGDTVKLEFAAASETPR